MHTKEPWEVRRDTHRVYFRTLAYVPVHTRTDYHETYIVAPNAEIPVHPKEHDSVRKDGEDNARRIVAAVNACEGISTADLERLGVGGLAKVLADLRVWRETHSIPSEPIQLKGEQ